MPLVRILCIFRDCSLNPYHIVATIKLLSYLGIRFVPSDYLKLNLRVSNDLKVKTQIHIHRTVMVMCLLAWATEGI